MNLDENGWRIPRAGTRSRLVYELTIRGETRSSIARVLKMNVQTVGSLIFKFRHPVAVNAVSNVYLRDRYATRRWKNYIDKAINVVGWM